ncbi:MAG: PepSY domain-containing protein [Phyllobacterium sp.]
MRILVVAVIISAAAMAPCSAAEQCSEPLSDWQPRETLRLQLEAQGWDVLSIKATDGCYEVVATNADGKKVDAYFDPKSFEWVQLIVEN